MNLTPRSRYRAQFRACAAGMSVSLMASLVSISHAADGTWNTVTDNSLWSTSTNWVGGTGADVADGAAFTAFFNNVNPTAATTVRLDSSRTIGTLVFGDTDTATAGRWILDNNGVAGNILTLGGAATITVNTMTSGAASTAPNVTISAVIDGTNGLTKNGTGTNSAPTGQNVNGTGTLTLSGTNIYTGATNINTGTIRATNSSAFGGVTGDKINTNVVNIADGARLVVSTTIANTVNLNGSNALAVAGGSGTLSGIVNVQTNSGVWVTDVGGNNTLTFSSAGSLNLGSRVLTLSSQGSAQATTIAGILTGDGTSGITKNGGGPLTMSGDGSGYSGTTTINSGELRVGSANGLGTGTLAIAPPNNGSVTIRSTTVDDRSTAIALSLPTTTNNGNSTGILRFGAASTGGLTFTNTAAISLGTTGRTFDVLSRTQFDAGFTTTGTAGLIKTGAATLVMNGASTYGGGTTVSSGTFQLGNGGTTGSLSASSTSLTVASGATFAVNRSNAVVQGTDFKMGITGAGNFTQAGGGTTTMATGNTYTGTTTISAGTLALGASDAFADASNFVMSGGTFAVGTFMDTIGTLSLTGNAAITLGAGGALAFADSDAINWGSNTLSITGTFVDGFSIRFGTDAIGGLSSGQLALISINGNFGTTIDSSGFLVAAIPEPSTYAIIAGGAILGLALLRRRRV